MTNPTDNGIALANTARIIDILAEEVAAAELELALEDALELIRVQCMASDLEAAVDALLAA